MPKGKLQVQSRKALEMALKVSEINILDSEQVGDVELVIVSYKKPIDLFSAGMHYQRFLSPVNTPETVQAEDTAKVEPKAKK